MKKAKFFSSNEYQTVLIAVKSALKKVLKRRDRLLDDYKDHDRLKRVEIMNAFNLELVSDITRHENAVNLVPYLQRLMFFMDIASNSEEFAAFKQKNPNHKSVLFIETYQMIFELTRQEY